MGYVGAPYNFVSLPDKVMKRYESREDLPKHNQIKEESYSGEIEYTFESQTPIFVGGAEKINGVEQFYRASDGSYAISASSMRGMLRNNMQILGLGAIGEDVESFKLMYRAVADKSRANLTKEYKDVLGVKMQDRHSVCMNVRAGYLENKNGKYFRYDAEEISKNRQNYYIVDEKEVIKRINDAEERKQENPFGFLLNDKKNKLQHKKDWDKNSKYQPYCEEISYEVQNGKIIAIGKPKHYHSCGWVLSSGAINSKKVFYVIPAKKNQVGVEISSKDIDAYKRDFENKKNQLGKNKDFYALPRNGEIRPIYYVYYKHNNYFGYTPYLRIFYNHSIGDGIPEEHKGLSYDYTRSIFGYSQKIDDKTENFKGRVSFEDAKVDKEKMFKDTSILLAGPKASSYMNYLVQETEDETTYNDDGLQIRGYKQYWLRENLGEYKGEKNEKMDTKFLPLESGTKFTGKVRFQGLREDELGLLLWCIKLNQGCYQNIGKAKAYGYGQLKLEDLNLRILDYDKLYRQKIIDFQPYTDQDNSVDDLVQKYKAYVKANFERDIEKEKTIKEFFIMKSFLSKPEQNRYMLLKEYKERKALPTVEEVKSGEKKPPKKTSAKPEKARKTKQSNNNVGTSLADKLSQIKL